MNKMNTLDFDSNGMLIILHLCTVVHKKNGDLGEGNKLILDLICFIKIMAGSACSSEIEVNL